MTGRMESVENLVRQRERFAPQRQIFHPSHRPLEIAGAIPTFPQPDDDSLLQTYKPQNQGDTSTGLTQGTFLLGLDMAHYPALTNVSSRWYSANGRIFTDQYRLTPTGSWGSAHTIALAA